jgi:ferredoxin
MITAERKPLEEILKSLESYDDITIAACGTCVTVCMAGGEKEALELKTAVELARMSEGKPVRVTVVTPKRQCDTEFLDDIMEDLNGPGAVLSLGCGVGVQFLSEKLKAKPVLPGVNTKFMGATRDIGVWTEMCQGCGDCLLERTGGVCPVARCSKSNLNGPCGGSQNGKCEISPDTDCGWQLIYNRLKELGRLDRLYDIIEPKDWRTSRDGGPRRIEKKEVRVL